MKIFVAGATGVIGRRLIPLLVDAGGDVTAVARSPAKAAQLKKQGAKPVTVDLFDPAAVEEAVLGHQTVINIATRIPSGMKVMLPGAFDENIRIRREASQNLASGAIAARAQRFIQESFAPAYPDCGSEWIDESVEIRPATYIESVRDAESAADEFTKSGGAGVVLRFSLFYGPDSSLTQDIVRAMKTGIAPFFGGPEAYMSSIWTDDAAAAVFAALKVPPGVYNVTDDEPMRRGEAFELLAAALDARPPRVLPRWLTMITGSLGDTLGRSLRLSNAKFRQASGWTPTVPSVRTGWKVLVSEMKSAGLMPA
ncbi:MAG TPA: NAD(P)-dependent oxidoreductase [Gemmatimonadaceae bacterium]|nr:NAD(P)-dependent oxidoreductase [Gemmatimonadaceae bacterium]